MSDKEEGLIQQPHHKWQTSVDAKAPFKPDKDQGNGQPWGILVAVDDKMHQEFKALAKARGKSMREVLNELVAEEIRRSPKDVKEGLELLAEIKRENPHRSTYREKCDAAEKELVRLTKEHDKKSTLLKKLQSEQEPSQR